MDKRDQKEEKNKRIGWMTSVGVQLVLLILFYFLIAWREPFPPIPEYGIELGFTSSAGASSSASKANQIQEESESEEVIEEADQIAEEITEEVVQETTTEEVVEQTETVTQEVEDVPIVEEKAAEKTEKVVKEEPKEEKKPTVDQRAVMPPTSSEADGDNEKKSDGKEENKEIDQRALYGNSGTNTGSNEGASLSLSGWMWDFKPKPNDTSDQSGKIVYRIVVDQDGYLVKIETVTSTVSPAVERKYREAVQKLTFSKTGDYKSAPLSTGTVTFIIKSK